jgi:putative transposase
MGRLQRITLPGMPYHVTQRGNRRQPVFFEEADYEEYLRLLKQQAARWGLHIWAYCLMTNHVHLIVVPEHEASLTRGLAETHRRYTRYINFRESWRGYLWQGRFSSVPLDESHLVAAMRYVERNPVDAGLVATAVEYPWSSARAHCHHTGDPLLSACFLTEQLENWEDFLRHPADDKLTHHLEAQLRTGRPSGSNSFLNDLERKLGRPIRRQPPGPRAIIG